MQKQKLIGRWLRRLLRTLIVTIGVIIIGCLVFDHYVQFRRPDKVLKKIFAEQHINAGIHYYTSHGRRLRYVAAGDDTLPVLLFLHGSPGSISYYSRRYSDSHLTVVSECMQLIARDTAIRVWVIPNRPFKNSPG